jgi:hypothetical protein
MSGCGARMKPIGLSYKKDGELMIVHQCLNCGKISPNRIAGDDNSYNIVSLLEESNRPTNSNIRLLTQEDKEMVLTTLYGYDYQKYLK